MLGPPRMAASPGPGIPGTRDQHAGVAPRVRAWRGRCRGCEAAGRPSRTRVRVRPVAGQWHRAWFERVAPARDKGGLERGQDPAESCGRVLTVNARSLDGPKRSLLAGAGASGAVW